MGKKVRFFDKDIGLEYVQKHCPYCIKGDTDDQHTHGHYYNNGIKCFGDKEANSLIEQGLAVEVETDIRMINIELPKRVETGAVQFGDDWPGLFIRGDDCLELRALLEIVLYETVESMPEKNYIKHSVFIEKITNTIDNNVKV